MVKQIIELISEIMEKGKFEKSSMTTKQLRIHLNNLFLLYKKEPTQMMARLVYSAIVDLARLGKGSLAHEYALRFEEEIGYDNIEEE
ncbi:MAG: hypothetical protein N3D20_00640 [Candidatus Pacearchaeota archaeon]|nr:hypothetical protein [Candidatus Pacearchaeota archaeon]